MSAGDVRWVELPAKSELVGRLAVPADVAGERRWVAPAGEVHVDLVVA